MSSPEPPLPPPPLLDPPTLALAGPAPQPAPKPPKCCIVAGASCDLCGLGIPLQAHIWPIEPPLEKVADDGPPTKRRAKGKYWWVHVACAEKYLGQLKPPPCIRFEKRGQCDYGEDCFYLHPSKDQLPAPQLSTSAAEEAAPGQGWAKRKKIRNASKCSALRRFLIDTFGGIEGLRKGAGVVDIAGGRGDLSFELLN